MANDGPLCGREKKQGEPGELCEQTAGWGTDHPGIGPCKLHGGATPIKHGRYSKITRPKLKKILQDLEADADPFDLIPELMLLRALVLDYIERHDALTEALLMWHMDGAPPTAKPRQLPDVITVGKFIGEIGGLVEKIQKSKREGSITLETMNRAMEAMGVELVKAAQEAIADEDQRANLLRLTERGWGSIRL